MRFYILLLTSMAAFVLAAPMPNADVGCIPKVVDGVESVDKRCVGFIAVCHSQSCLGRFELILTTLGRRSTYRLEEKSRDGREKGSYMLTLQRG